MPSLESLAHSAQATRSLASSNRRRHSSKEPEGASPCGRKGQAPGGGVAAAWFGSVCAWFGVLVSRVGLGPDFWGRGCFWGWVGGAGVGLGGVWAGGSVQRGKTQPLPCVCGHDSAMCHVFPSLHGEVTPLHGQLRDLDKEMFPSHLGCCGVCLYGWVG